MRKTERKLRRSRGYKFAGLLRAVGRNVRAARVKKNLTQGGLAAMAEVHRTHINEIEWGSASPSLVTLGKLAMALGVPIDDLFKGVRLRGERRKRNKIAG